MYAAYSCLHIYFLPVILRSNHLSLIGTLVDGLEGFSDVCQSLLLGDNNVIVREGKVHTIQTLSGTGALRLAFDFLHCFMSKNKVTNADTVVYYPSTTWANHPEILKVTHFPTATYRYLDSTGCSLDFDGLCEDLSHAAPNSVFLFHMCGHNPTGMQFKLIHDAVTGDSFCHMFVTLDMIPAYFIIFTRCLLICIRLFSYCRS